MSRNPHATNLRHHRQQIIADKREKLFKGLADDTRHAYVDMDTLLVWDDDLGLCSVDLTRFEAPMVPVDDE